MYECLFSEPLHHLPTNHACWYRCFAKSLQHKTYKITREEDLYSPIVICLYEPVNLAAEVLGLPAMFSKTLGKSH